MNATLNLRVTYAMEFFFVVGPMYDYRSSTKKLKVFFVYAGNSLIFFPLFRGDVLTKIMSHDTLIQMSCCPSYLLHHFHLQEIPDVTTTEFAAPCQHGLHAISGNRDINALETAGMGYSQTKFVLILI